MIALTTPFDDPTPNGLYRLSGEVLDGWWVYELAESTDRDRRPPGLTRSGRVTAGLDGQIEV